MLKFKENFPIILLQNKCSICYLLLEVEVPNHLFAFTILDHLDPKKKKKNFYKLYYIFKRNKILHPFKLKCKIYSNKIEFSNWKSYTFSKPPRVVTSMKSWCRSRRFPPTIGTLLQIMYKRAKSKYKQCSPWNEIFFNWRTNNKHIKSISIS